MTQLLTEHRSQLESLAKALIAAETLDAADAYAAAGVNKTGRRVFVWGSRPRCMASPIYGMRTVRSPGLSVVIQIFSTSASALGLAFSAIVPALI